VLGIELLEIMCQWRRDRVPSDEMRRDDGMVECWH
jgi:hypothetical protein